MLTLKTMFGALFDEEYVLRKCNTKLCECFFCEDTVDRIGKEVRSRLTPGLCGGPRG